MTNGRSPTLVTLPPWRAAACPSGHSYSMAISIATSARSMTTFSRGLPGVTRSTEICAWVCSEESVRVSPVAGSVTCSRYSGEGIAPAQAFPAPVFIPVVASVPSSPSCKRRSICPLPIRYSVICPSPSVHGPETFSPWAGFPYPAPFARHGRNRSSGLLLLPCVFTDPIARKHTTSPFLSHPLVAEHQQFSLWHRPPHLGSRGREIGVKDKVER